MTLFNATIKRDLLKLCCLGLAIGGTITLFALTPLLSTPAMLAVVSTLILSPLVATLERRGFQRVNAIILIFSIITVLLCLGAFLTFQSWQDEWETFRQNAPQYFKSSIIRLRELEALIKKRFTFLNSINPTDTLLAWGEGTGLWFVTQGPRIAGELFSCLLITPFMTFVLLNDGPTLRRRFVAMVPNRFFEQVFMLSHEITTAIADYIRAKFLEAALVTILTIGGLALIKAPYAVVLGIIAGVTNIIPYLGPVLGAIPGIAIIALDGSNTGMLLGVILVYTIANIIDTVVIFPLVVAKLVNLHPVILIAAVAIGQKYYGLVGMLISVPIAAALKVIIQATYTSVYETKSDIAYKATQK